MARVAVGRRARRLEVRGRRAEVQAVEIDAAAERPGSARRSGAERSSIARAAAPQATVPTPPRATRRQHREGERARHHAPHLQVRMSSRLRLLAGPAAPPAGRRHWYRSGRSARDRPARRRTSRRRSRSRYRQRVEPARRAPAESSCRRRSRRRRRSDRPRRRCRRLPRRAVARDSRECGTRAQRELLVPSAAPVAPHRHGRLARREDADAPPVVDATPRSPISHSAYCAAASRASPTTGVSQNDHTISRTRLPRVPRASIASRRDPMTAYSARCETRVAGLGRFGRFAARAAFEARRSPQLEYGRGDCRIDRATRAPPQSVLVSATVGPDPITLGSSSHHIREREVRTADR